jgi:hypothetical protein
VVDFDVDDRRVHPSRAIIALSMFGSYIRRSFHVVCPFAFKCATEELEVSGRTSRDEPQADARGWALESHT